jgi:PAS domain S-box-containing protein
VKPGRTRDDALDAAALDHVDLAIIATDRDGCVVTWNARAESLYGWSKDEALGRPIGELTVPADEGGAAQEIIDAVVRGESWEGEFRVRGKDGRIFSAYVKNSPIFDDAGDLIGIVGVSVEMQAGPLAAAVRSAAHNARERAKALSPREREVLGLLARGLTGEQIAARLALSPETVRTHVRNAREKLGASTRVEAVTMALVANEITV